MNNETAMDITFRLEKKADYRTVENLTREAFWDVYHPGCNEHLVIHKLRDSPCFIPELDFVAELNQQIVGHIAYSRAKVVDEKKQVREILCLAPISVSPDIQKRGIGGKLIEYTKIIARNLGYKGIVLFGSPAYYSKFGFKNAEQFHITTSDGENFDAFMAIELEENSLAGIHGKFYEDEVFHLTLEETEEFDKKFPYKEKHITDTQLK